MTVASLAGRSDSFYVDGVVNGELRSLLLDTGATMTILSPKSIPDGKGIQPSTWTLKTATGANAEVFGEAVANFVIGGTSFQHRALVANIDEDVILGTDIMTRFGFLLDLNRKVITIGEEEVILQRGKNLSARLVLDEDTVFQECSQVIAKARLDRMVPEGQSLVLEPDMGEGELGRGLLVARMLFLAGEEIPVRLMNLNSYPVTLKKGSILGHCSAISSVVQRVRNSIPVSKNLPDSLAAFVQDTCRELPEEHKREVKELITRYQDIFETGNGPKGRTKVVEHRIDTGEARPIRQVPRRLPLAKREEAERIIKEMERDGVIEPSNSPWISPVVLVKKKDGTSRFCVDYRLLNNVTKKDSYPLPRIDDTLDTLDGCEIFSTLDLKSGYWQVGVSPKDREKTAFSIGTGLWQFTVMPFGLCNAPATFERLMESVLRGLSWETCLVYLDDIIVLGKSFRNHLQNLDQVFQRLREANLKLNPKKCNLFRRKVNFLGHVVSAEGVSVDPEKVATIKEWPRPKDKHEVRSFLGLCTYYRRYVPGFSSIAKPITKLTEDRRSFNWDSDCQQAFEELKRTLSSAPILSYPRPEGKFILDTDASNCGIGGVLSQMQDGHERVIGYFSKTLSKPERNYCVTRRELLAVVKSVEHFHKYLYGRKFLLRTDHASLTWLLKFKATEGQVARWIERLQEYDFASEHRSGSSHQNADALSRRPCSEDCKHCSRVEEKSATILRTTAVNDSWQEATVLKDQEEDPDLKVVLGWKRTGRRPSWNEIAHLSPTLKTYWAQWNSLVIEDGVLRRVLESADGSERKRQLLVPKKRIPEVLKELHDGISGGHLGVHKTLEKTRQRFYWVRQKEDVKDWCRKCVTCASANGPQKRRVAPMRQYNVGAPFERIAIDVAGPFPSTDRGNRYILVAMDYFTKWVEAYALPNQEAVTIAEVLVKELISRFGIPLELHCDQGRNFESQLFTELCRILGVRKTRTTALHPQSDGMVERMNRTTGKYLSKVVAEHQRDWDHHLPFFLLAYRSSVHETTGQTPANVLFGRELRLPCDLQFGCKPDEDVAGEDYISRLKRRMDDIHEKVRSNMQHASDRMKTRYDIKAETGGFQPGDLVWLYNPHRRRGYSPKLQRSWDGPYEIVTRINDVIYRIKKQPNGKPRVVHINRLALYKGDNAAGNEQVLRACRSRRLTFDEFMNNVDTCPRIYHGVTRTVHQDLFSVPSEYALANCVASDLQMTRGIARVFKSKYGATEFPEQHGSPAVGEALHLYRKERHLFYMVTKKLSNGKPTYRAIWDSLINLRHQLLHLGLKKLGIPRLGCGLDGLDWKTVRSMIEELFKDTGIDILVCFYDPRLPRKKDNSPSEEELDLRTPRHCEELETTCSGTEQP